MGHRSGLRAAQVVVALGAAALLWLPTPASASATRVIINGKRVQLPSTATVQEALEAARVELRVGFMRTVATGEPVPDRVRRPRIYVNDRLVKPTHRIGAGDRITVVNGEDFVEPLSERTEEVPVPGLPAIETQIWQAGKAGVVKRIVGRYSGQPAGEVVLAQPLPAAPVAAPQVLLSFDDGPDGRWTPQVLDILKAKDVKAVFCLVGVQMRRYPQLVQRIHAEGHTLCNHSEHHDMRMQHKSNEYVTAQIEGPMQLFRDLTGTTPRFYRGPGGGVSPFILSEIHRLGMRFLAWDTDPADYRKPGAGTIQNRIALTIGNGGVALLHDGGGDRSQTVAQLPGLIDRLRAAGYSIVVVP